MAARRRRTDDDPVVDGRVRVADVGDGKGRGMVATACIPAGTVLIDEAPLELGPLDSLDARYAAVAAVLAAGLDGLLECDPELTSPTERAMDVIHRNGFVARGCAGAHSSKIGRAH